MPYTIRKQKCKQSDGDSGGYTLSYTDNKGKKHRACHTSRKKARGQIAAIEGPRENAQIDFSESMRMESLLRKAIQGLLYEKRSEALFVAPTPDLQTFSALMHDIVGSALTISSDINEISAVATINKGSPVDITDAAQYAQGGSAAAVLNDRFQQVLSRAKSAGYSKEDAMSYIAGELARGSALGMAAIRDAGGGEAFWTADRGASLAEFVNGEVSRDNPTDFLVVTSEGYPIGYSAKSTAGAASNFKNPGLKEIEDLAGYPSGESSGRRATEVQSIYDAGNKKMNRIIKGYTSLTQEEKKEYRDIAAENGLYDFVQGGVRDLLLDGISNTLSTKKGQSLGNMFLRSVVPDLPNPPFKVVFGKGLTGATIKPPSGSESVSMHMSTPGAILSVQPSGINGITFISSVAGKLFTYRIKFMGGYGTSLKGAVAN